MDDKTLRRAPNEIERGIISPEHLARMRARVNDFTGIDDLIHKGMPLYEVRRMFPEYATTLAQGYAQRIRDAYDGQRFMRGYSSYASSLEIAAWTLVEPEEMKSEISINGGIQEPVLTTLAMQETDPARALTHFEELGMNRYHRMRWYHRYAAKLAQTDPTLAQEFVSRVCWKKYCKQQGLIAVLGEMCEKDPAPAQEYAKRNNTAKKAFSERMWARPEIALSFYRRPGEEHILPLLSASSTDLGVAQHYLRHLPRIGWNGYVRRIRNSTPAEQEILMTNSTPPSTPPEESVNYVIERIHWTEWSNHNFFGEWFIRYAKHNREILPLLEHDRINSRASTNYSDGIIRNGVRRIIIPHLIKKGMREDAEHHASSAPKKEQPAHYAQMILALFGQDYDDYY